MQFHSRIFGSVAVTALTGTLMAGCGGDDDSPAPVAVAPFAATADCASLKTLSIPNTTILSADAIPAGSFTPPGSTTAFSSLPDFCRVVAQTSPVAGSHIGIEVWLPSKIWNGRYQQVGTHGTGGTVYWSEMAPQLRRGFATGATDAGHPLVPQATTDPLLQNRSSSWGIGNPEAVNDYGYRAVHELVDKAKTTILAYYGRKQDYAYLNGCSKGGQDGVKSAQVYPSDFNGIVAGGAAQFATQAATAQLIMDINLRNGNIQATSGTTILQSAQAATIAACDALDGVTDGFISNPTACHWNPSSLGVTSTQAAAIATNTTALVDPATGKKFFDSWTPGSEHDWIHFGHQNNLSTYALALYQIALGDGTWDGTNFNLTRDFPVLVAKLGAAIDAVDPNLAPFQKAGGKLIQWHTWDDSAFMPAATVNYYDQVTALLGGAEATQSFYRLFMMPAQGHCAGDGVGPSNFGQENALAVSSDSEHDVVTAIMDWVEKGNAPKDFVTTRFKNNDATQGVDMQRPICPYPLQAVYKGSGDTNVAANFSCSPAPATN